MGESLGKNKVDLVPRNSREMQLVGGLARMKNAYADVERIIKEIGDGVLGYGPILKSGVAIVKSEEMENIAVSEAPIVVERPYDEDDEEAEEEVVAEVVQEDVKTEKKGRTMSYRPFDKTIFEAFGIIYYNKGSGHRAYLTIDVKELKKQVKDNMPVMPVAEDFPDKWFFEQAMSAYEKELEDYEAELAWVDSVRPRTRGDCMDREKFIRPCPYVSCIHNLYLHVPKSGSLILDHPDIGPDEMPEECSCALDVAEKGEHTLEEVGVLLNLTRERVRQIEAGGLRRALRGLPPSIIRRYSRGYHNPEKEAKSSVFY